MSNFFIFLIGNYADDDGTGNNDAFNNNCSAAPQGSIEAEMFTLAKLLSFNFCGFSSTLVSICSKAKKLVLQIIGFLAPLV